MKGGRRVYARSVPNVMGVVLRHIVRQKIPHGSTIYSDGLKGHAGLLTNSYRHCLILQAQMFTAVTLTG